MTGSPDPRDPSQPLSAEDVRAASAVPVLARLDPLERADTLRAAHVETYPSGALVVREGDTADAFYVVLAGRLQIAAERDSGPPLPLAELGPGTWFGEQALLAAGGRRTASVRAIEPLRCAVIPRPAFTAHIAPANRAAFDEAAVENLRSRQLRSLDALRDLDPARQIHGGVTRVPYRPGDAVFERGADADAVYFVLDGIAVVVRNEPGGTCALARLGPGQCFGELGVIEARARQASVMAETDLAVLRIEATLFRELFAAHPPLRDFLGTLQRIYALADGRRLSVYSGDVDGRPSVSTVCGDPAGDCVISTKILGEDVIVLARGGASPADTVTSTFRFPDRAAVRELRLAPLERGDQGTVRRARLLGVVVRGIGPDVGPLYARVLSGAELGATELKRFAQTGYLGGAAEVRDPSRVCHCLGLARADVLSAATEHGATLGAVGMATGAGMVCGACQPVVEEILRATIDPTAAPRPAASTVPETMAHEAPIPVARCPVITFDADAVREVCGATFFQLLIAASLFASAGERFMIRHVGRAAAAIDDPALTAHVEAFLAQESNHVTVHTPLNTLVVEQIFPGSPGLQRLHAGLPHYLDRLPEGIALAFCAAIEHAADSFFSVFFERYYGTGPDAGHFDTDPALHEPAVRSGLADLFVWHGAEELAHRHVAFDVMQARGARYAERAIGLALLVAHSTGLGVPAVVAIRRRAAGWRRRGRTADHLRDLARTVGRTLGFLRPGFHPRETEYPFTAALEREVSRHPIDPHDSGSPAH